MLFALALALLGPQGPADYPRAGEESVPHQSAERTEGARNEGGLDGDWEVDADPRSAELTRRYRAAIAALNNAYSRRESALLADEIYFGAFLALALEGEAQAILWCLDPGRNLLWMGLDQKQAAISAVRRTLWHELVARGQGIEQRLLDGRVLHWLAQERVLPRRDALEIAETFAARAHCENLQAWALYAQARLTASWDCEPGEERTRALALVNAARAQGRKDPALVKLAEDASFRWRELNIGAIAPNFCTTDARGNEICLEDLRGQVVLVRFYSFNESDIRKRLSGDAFLVRRYWDLRFAMVGINTDLDSSEVTQHEEETHVRWPHAWEAGHNGSAGRAWHISDSTTLLLDQRGAIVAIDPDEESLSALIENLLQASEPGLSSASTGSTASAGRPAGNAFQR